MYSRSASATSSNTELKVSNIARDQHGATADSWGGDVSAARAFERPDPPPYAKLDAEMRLFEDSHRRRQLKWKRKVTVEEERVKKEMSECSFRPVICPGSAAQRRNIESVPDQDAFFRLANDRRRFHQKMEEERQRQQKENEPSFAPEVLQNRVASEFIERYESLDVANRLYSDAVYRIDRNSAREAEQEQALRAKAVAHLRCAQRRPPDRCQRLYEQSSQRRKELSIYAARQRLLEEEDFTFHPNVNSVARSQRRHSDFVTTPQPSITRTRSVDCMSRAARQRMQYHNATPQSILKNAQYRAERDRIIKQGGKTNGNCTVTERLLMDSTRRLMLKGRVEDCATAQVQSVSRDPPHLEKGEQKEVVERLMKPVACQDANKIGEIQQLELEQQQKLLDDALARSSARYEKLKSMHLLDPGAVTVHRSAAQHRDPHQELVWKEVAPGEGGRKRSDAGGSWQQQAKQDDPEVALTKKDEEERDFHRSEGLSRRNEELAMKYYKRLGVDDELQKDFSARQLAAINIEKRRVQKLYRRDVSHEVSTHLEKVPAVRYPAPLSSMPTAVPIRGESDLRDRRKRAKEISEEKKQKESAKGPDLSTLRKRDGLGHVYTVSKPFAQLELHEKKSREYKGKVLEQSLRDEGCTFHAFAAPYSVKVGRSKTAASHGHMPRHQFSPVDYDDAIPVDPHIAQIQSSGYVRL